MYIKEMSMHFWKTSTFILHNNNDFIIANIVNNDTLVSITQPIINCLKMQFFLTKKQYPHNYGLHCFL
jgi:hypothetical protein